MRKIFLLALLTTCFAAAKAQDKSSASAAGFHFAAGLDLALPVGDLSDVESFGIGAEIQPEYNISDEASFVGSTGYTRYIAKKDFDGVGFIPVLVGARYYPTPSFFVGGKVGLGIFTGSGDSESSFAYQPQIGYNASKVQLALSYNGWNKDNINFSSLSLSLLYKFK